MFNSIKSIFTRSKRSNSLSANFITIRLSGTDLLCLIQQTALSIYSKDHKFVHQYLLPYFNLKNEQLIKELDSQISSISEQKYLTSQLPEILQMQISKSQGYLYLIKSFWYSYMETSIKNQYDSTKFFRTEVALIVELMLALIKEIYKQYDANNIEFKMQSRKFRIKLVQALTDSYEFQKIKTMFVKQFKLGCGVNGDFSSSQVQLTIKQLDQLVQFKQIPAPFHQSISIMHQFYKECRLRQKVKLLVEVVDKAKSQIIQYRSFFSMQSKVIGSDQIMPIINFICQKTNKNIYASIQYIRALLGGKNYNDDQCRLCLREIEDSSEYCLDLVESMASIWCHASKMIV